jgi:hypothetical protein
LIGVAMMEAGRRRAIDCGEARGRFQPGSGGMGETTKLTSGARVAVAEGEEVAAGLCKLEEEAASGNYAKATQARMGRARVHGPREEGGAGEGGRAERPDGPLGRSGPKVKKNSFLNKNRIFDYSKALEIFRRRFMRYFDMRIFPKFF